MMIARNWHDPKPIEPPWNGRPTLPDVRFYRNDSTQVTLCISCAVARRRGGAAVELVSEKVMRGGCVYCGSQEGRE